MRADRSRRGADLNAENARDAARLHLERRWKPVPVSHEQKAPSSPGWPAGEMTPVDEYFDSAPNQKMPLLPGPSEQIQPFLLSRRQVAF
jgi:hypothetical protein